MHLISLEPMGLSEGDIVAFPGVLRGDASEDRVYVLFGEVGDIALFNLNRYAELYHPLRLTGSTLNIQGGGVPWREAHIDHLFLPQDLLSNKAIPYQILQPDDPRAFRYTEAQRLVGFVDRAMHVFEAELFALVPDLLRKVERVNRNLIMRGFTGDPEEVAHIVSCLKWINTHVREMSSRRELVKAAETFSLRVQELLRS